MSRLQEQVEKWRSQCIKLKYENDELIEQLETKDDDWKEIVYNLRIENDKLKKGDKMLNGYSDKILLDYLQQLTDETNRTSSLYNKVVLRDSMIGRGFRLHETSGYDDTSCKNVRQAIINYIEERKKNYHE